jgi:predicted ATPase/DNA-binding winged helix-turn-helix (wHTH) protein
VTEPPAIRFGSFTFSPIQRQLFKDGQPVKLGSRALDLLGALVSRPGETIGSAELIGRIWPGLHVEETNLRVQVAALRKALGESEGSPFITNVPARGYCFTAPVSPAVDTVPSRTAKDARLLSPTRRSVRLIGRGDLIEELAAQIGPRRLVTLVGPGGIGKTSLAVALCEQLSGSHQDGSIFVDLGTVAEGGLVLGAVASACGISLHSTDPLLELARSLATKDVLLILDCCEHVIDAAAATAEQLIAQGYGVNILATSREPLRAEGEWVHRLEPLQVPGAETHLTAESALRYSAVELFVERASAALGGYALTDEDAPAVAAVCRRLDGIALALEFAAGRVDTLGIAGLARSLETSFRTLTRGRRTALPRHQTLRAMLDWSYGTLSPCEQTVLDRLSVFVGGFTLEAACAVTASPGCSPHDVEDAVASLAGKSLVSIERPVHAPRHRLLDMTREYASEKLQVSGEAGVVASLHARHYSGVFEEAASRAGRDPAQEWLHRYGREIGNLRAALDWATSENGDTGLAVALTVASVPLWYRLSLIDEALDRVRSALAEVELEATPDPRARMHLYAALGWPQMRASSDLPSGAAAWRKVLALAEELDDSDFQLRALWALWLDQTNKGRLREALATAGTFQDRAAAAHQPNDALIGERLAARSLHLLGEQTDALSTIESVLDRYMEPEGRPNLTRFQYDQRISMRITLARALWFTGSFERALLETKSLIEEASALEHRLTLCVALADAACPLTLMAGDLASAERYIGLLAEKTERQFLDVWKAYAECYAGELVARRGRPLVGAAQMENAISQLERSGFIQYQAGFVGACAAALIEGGSLDRAETMITHALARGRETGDAWYCPELLRLQGEVLLSRSETASAVDLLRTSLRLARSQGARALELKAASSLARALRAHGDPDGAVGELRRIVGIIAQGSTVADALAARSLLKEIASAA